MTTYRLDDVRVVLAEPRVDIRQDLEQSLRSHGFEQILITGTMSSVVQAIEEGTVDLLIGDTVLPEGDLSGLVSEMRHGKVGSNPFLVTITLVSNPTQDIIRGVINSGTDGVLLKPISPDQMWDRVVQLIERRKRFVVTTDYIGPDRRSKPRSDGMQIPLIPVPNPLRDRVFGNTDPRRTKRALEGAMARINEEKVERHAYQIGWLVKRILPALNTGDVGEEEQAHLDKLVKVSDDLCARIKETRFIHVAGMCMSVSQMARTIQDASGKVDDETLRLLKQLPTLISRAFDTESTDAGGEDASPEAAAS